MKREARILSPTTSRTWSMNRNANALFLALSSLVLLLATTARAEDGVRLTCTPQAFQAVPGEPLRLHLTVHAAAALRFRWLVPDDPRLQVRAIEKLPVQRTRQGLVVYQRVILWQGLEPGTVRIEALAIETRNRKLFFPEVNITVRDPGP
jgi:hypothetical protein